MRVIEFPYTLYIGFSEKLGVGFNLLGRKDIFDVFRVCFSDDTKILSFYQD